MKYNLRRYAVILTLTGACLAQEAASAPKPPGTEASEDVRLPNGHLQKDEIAKAEYAQNLKDAQQLVRLSRQLRDSLARTDGYVVSLADLKKTDDIEKLAKKIRGRLRHN